jgi:hypothetical protein
MPAKAPLPLRQGGGKEIHRRSMLSGRREGSGVSMAVMEPSTLGIAERIRETRSPLRWRSWKRRERHGAAGRARTSLST